MLINLLIIDPQNSFGKVVPEDQQQILHDGELYVAGNPGEVSGEKAMENTSDLINDYGKKFDTVGVTLDSHHELHIANRPYLRDGDGNMPDPFTLMRENNGKIESYDPITGNTIRNDYHCFVPELTKWTLNYLKQLATDGKYPHCMWNCHCLIGTPGHNVVSSVRQALFNWALDEKATVEYCTKGSNYRVEHFSGVKAQVVDPDDPSTELNTDLIQQMTECDHLLVAGLARNFCVYNTVNDIFEFDSELLKKMIVLEDCTSSVPGFDFLDDKFNELKKEGLRFTTSKDYFG